MKPPFDLDIEYNFDDLVDDIGSYEENILLCQKILGEDLYTQVIWLSKLYFSPVNEHHHQAVGELARLLSYAVKLYGPRGALSWWRDWRKIQPAVDFGIDNGRTLFKSLANESGIYHRVYRHVAGLRLR